MKITEIIKDQTTPEHITFRVEPPLTKEVFEAFQDHLKHTSYPARTLVDGNLRIRFDEKLAAQSIDTLNKSLTTAEKSVHDAQEEDKRNRERFLGSLSNKLGLEVK